MNDSPTFQEVADLVNTLNEEAWEATQDDVLSNAMFEVMSNGIDVIVRFLGIDIWNESDDERPWMDGNGLFDQNGENKEPLEAFLRRRAMEILKVLAKVNLCHPASP